MTEAAVVIEPNILLCNIDETCRKHQSYDILGNDIIYPQGRYHLDELNKRSKENSNKDLRQRLIKKVADLPASHLQEAWDMVALLDAAAQGKKVPIEAKPNDKYRKRSNKKETIIAFINRMYADRLTGLMTRAHLRHIDYPAYCAISRYEQLHGKISLEVMYLPTKKQANDTLVEEMKNTGLKIDLSPSAPSIISRVQSFHSC